jgi:hypothetical protein
MGTVTAYDMASIQSALGGSNPIGLNEYYRGGPYVPTTGTDTVREPTTGDNYNLTPPRYFWAVEGIYNSVWWNNTSNSAIGASLTSLTVGSYTYYRGTFQQNIPSCCGPVYYYRIYRTSTTTVSINTGVPSSGQISISQLYGARNP